MNRSSTAIPTARLSRPKAGLEADRRTGLISR
jgi:hypothetical protein